MEWEPLAPPVKKAGNAKIPVRVGMSSIRGERAKMSVLLRTEVLDLIGEGRARRYSVDLGHGMHAHQIRIRQDDLSNFEASEMGVSKGGGVWRIRLPEVERFPRVKISPEPVKWEHDKAHKCLIVTLPAWAWDEGSRRRLQSALRIVR